MAKASTKTKQETSGKRRLETGMLSFARSLQPSEGLLWGTRSADGKWREPIEVREKGVRGQSSEFKTDNPGKSNPQVVEAAAIPSGCDGVRLEFSMWVLPHAMKPWACDDADVAQAYVELVRDYAAKGGFDCLARRYLWNIANARVAWRNRYQADDMRVEVEFDNKKITFDPTRLDLETPANDERLAAATGSNEPAPVTELIGWIAQGLKSEGRPLRVAWCARMNEGQEVFPSQEYLRDEKKKEAASRVYAKLPYFWQGRSVYQASMHSQKIGAALRHIDDWHNHAAYKVIAINPYGGVQETGDVLRVEKERKGLDAAKSFYALRSNAEELFSAIDAAVGAEEIPGDVHFVIANLVRGGVFGQKGGSDA